MNNVLVLPILIPFITVAVLLFFAKNIKVQRIVSTISMLSILAVSIYLAITAYTSGDIRVLEFGNWSAPFGIVFVGDLLSTLLVLVTSILGTVSLFYAFQTISEAREKAYFYVFYFIIIIGVNGSFLTGDIFNLFVFFEVMLLASYALVVHGGTKYQLRESLTYVVINVFSSGLFVVALAWLYSVVGTLNMAHISERVAEMGQSGILNTIAMMLFVVFATKGALFPLYFWLPNTYSGPPSAITALFGGLLSKVGIYTIMRMFTLVFYHQPDFTHKLVISTIAGFTILVGAIGAVSNFDFKKILSYHIVSQVGYLVMGVGIFTPMALAGAIFYTVHEMIVKTALFLLAGVTEEVTGTSDLNKMGGLMTSHPALAWMFLVCGISLAGIPPFSGFFSKFPLLVAGFEQGQWVLAGVGLFVGLFTLFSMIKIFSYVYWGKQKHTPEQAKKPVGKLLLAVVPLVIMTIGLGFAASPMYEYTLQIAEQLLNPAIYIGSVL